MKIGELAEMTGCKIETIRYYEKQGLLPEPERTEGNYRDYGVEHLERLSFIRNCRNLDMAHVEVKELLHFLDSPDENCSGVNVLLEKHLEHVRHRILELTTLENQLIKLRKQCLNPDSADRCNILHDLSLSAVPGPKRADSHLGSVH